MSKKGLRYVAFGIRNDTTGTFSGGKHLSPAAAISGSANTSDVKDYGDDRVVETDKSVTGGTLTVELNHDEDEIYTMLLGHTKNENLISHNVDDVAPFVGVGCVGQSGSKWTAKIYTKVQFAEPADENNTKEESVQFNHITLEGDILIPEDGIWKMRQTFDTFALAKAWIDEKLSVTTTTPANPANPG